MTDYAAEQRQELEVLESIFPPEELEVISPREIKIRVESDDKDEDLDVTCALCITFSRTYPDEIPELTLEPLGAGGTIEKLSHDDMTSLLKELEAEATTNLGTVMIFTLVSHLKEGLNGIISRKHQAQSRAVEEKALAQEEKEQAKFKGEAVTAASFAAWKARFMQERKVAALRLNEGAGHETSIIPTSAGKRMTGKQMFLHDRSLAVEQGDLVDDVAHSIIENDAATSGPVT